MSELILQASVLAYGDGPMWQPWLSVLFGGSDLLHFCAYCGIPIALFRFLRMRPDL